MFIGHYALGFGAKRMAPSVSLGTLFLACQFADLLWPSLVMAGLERFEIDPGNTVVTPINFISYPYSHSLMALVVWAGVLALVHRALRGSTLGTASVLGGLVLSHWALDALTHRPDMPLTIVGTTRVGLGLWNDPRATIALESAMFAIGVGLYAWTTRSRDNVGGPALWLLVLFLAGLYAANLTSPPPPSVAAVAWSAQALWLVVVWGVWIDRHRQPT